MAKVKSWDEDKKSSSFILSKKDKRDMDSYDKTDFEYRETPDNESERIKEMAKRIAKRQREKYKKRKEREPIDFSGLTTLLVPAIVIFFLLFFGLYVFRGVTDVVDVINETNFTDVFGDGGSTIFSLLPIIMIMLLATSVMFVFARLAHMWRGHGYA